MNYRLDLGSEPVNPGVQKALAWRAEIIAPAKLPPHALAKVNGGWFLRPWGFGHYWGPSWEAMAWNMGYDRRYPFGWYWHYY